MSTVTKRPGWDWTVWYRWDDEPAAEAMVIFGAMSVEDALEDARQSLGKSDDYEILSLVRQDYHGRVAR